ncbi:MAG: C4-type zinc ribbon domain-containing protein [Actinomycetota bacterium]
MESITRESLRPLLDLQRIDTASDRLVQRRTDLPEQAELDELTQQRDEIADARVERQTELDAVSREQARIEVEVEQIDGKIQHEQARLYSGEVTNAKELSNIQAELDSLRRRKAHLEDGELEVMERREAVEAEVAALTASFESVEAGVADATARRDTASVDIEKQLAEFAAERAALQPTVHPEILELYDDARSKRGGVAVAALDKGVCRGCNLPLSPMAREEIRVGDDPLVRCENCRRLLVVV